ncbi:MAG TPA: SpoIID/LytB domain-containing protein [Moorella mulderi]|nr:SpoIID/LytB domain-containing protein [Moorella mulderi]
MKRISPFLTAGVFLFFLWIFCARASAQAPPSIRILLGQETPQAEFQVLRGDYCLVDLESGREMGKVAPGEACRAEVKGGILSLYRNSLETPLRCGLKLKALGDPGESLFAYRGCRYRGELTLLVGEKGLLAINTLDMERYLYGVVGKEMPASAPVEALKAQAIISRSYAYSHLRPAALYDLKDSEASQVYKGYEAELSYGPYSSRVKEAVDSTRGQVLLYEGKVVEACFHANAGGHTEDCENVWSGSRPYLKGVPSPEDDWAVRYPNQTPGGWPASSYTWSLCLSRQEVEDRVRSWLSRQGRSLEGQVVDLLFNRQGEGGGETVSGRVTRVDIKTTQGTITVCKDAIRGVVGLKSTLFQGEMDSTVYILTGGGRIYSKSYGGDLAVLGAQGCSPSPNGPAEEYFLKGKYGEKKVPKIFTRITFQGKGHGHGVGLSQWGAMGMAIKGYNCRQILEHYYNQGKFDQRLQVAALY